MKTTIGLGVLCGALVTIALTAVLYFADQLAGTPFVPYDLFDWMVQVLPGAVVTFGLDLMIDVLRVIGVGVAGTAKTAERAMAVGQFLLLGTAVGTVFFVIARLRGRSPEVVTGIVAGALLGLPMMAVSAGTQKRRSRRPCLRRARRASPPRGRGGGSSSSRWAPPRQRLPWRAAVWDT